MKNERGQVIVFVAFALVGLIAITGLAIDGGRLYQARRQSQNGADAAALAGARVMASHRCNPPSDLDARVETEVLQYAAQNSVLNDGVHGAVMAWYVRPAVGGDEDETERLTRVGSVGSVSEIMGATGIEVTTTISEPTTFMRITGQ
ncbi:MAG: pilus assembly protein TadG-related protein, partial [Anaerolineae bacterium]